MLLMRVSDLSLHEQCIIKGQCMYVHGLKVPADETDPRYELKLAELISLLDDLVLEHVHRKLLFQLGSYLVIWFPYACISIAETAG